MSSTAVQNGCPPPKKQRVEDVVGQAWRVRASRESRDCVNSLRHCEEIYFKEALEKRDKSKELIKVSLGERFLNCYNLYTWFSRHNMFSSCASNYGVT